MYLGTGAHLIRINGVDSEEVEFAETYATETTLEGNVFAEAIPVSRRAWGLSLKKTARHQDVSTLRDFARGAWGVGPFWWIGPEAAFANVLTPEAADLRVFTPGPGLSAAPTSGIPLATPDGFAPLGLIKGDDGTLLLGEAPIPVPAGVPITASCYVLGDGAQLGVTWHNAAGTATGTVLGSAFPAGEVGRSWVTATPPPGTTGARPFVTAPTVQIARPALTFANRLAPWADGRGCSKAIVKTMSASTSVAIHATVMQAVDFTIQEVG